MEITNQTPLLTAAKDHDKPQSAPDLVELEENGNIAVDADEKTPVKTDSANSRPVDQFFTHQARGDLSPIKPGATDDDVMAESLDLKLDDSCPRKSRSACVQPESFVCEPTNMFEVNILETTMDSKVDADQSHTDLLNESATSRKRPQTEMEPAVFEVPRLTKHPHTDAPPVPEFRDDSEPLIQFSSDNETVFRVAFSGENANDTAKSTSFLENSQGPALDENPRSATFDVSSETFDKGSATFDKGSATFDRGSAATGREPENVTNPAEGDAEPSADTKASKTTAVPGSNPKTIKSEESLSLSIIQSVDEFLDPLVRSVFPIMRRGTGLNTAFVCIPLVVASIFYFYFRN